MFVCMKNITKNIPKINTKSKSFNLMQCKVDKKLNICMCVYICLYIHIFLERQIKKIVLIK